MTRHVRIALGFLLVLGLLTLAGRASIGAQDADPDALAGHPAVGSWQWDNDPFNPGTNVTYAIFHADGTYLEVGPLNGVGIGVWRPTGERSAEVSYVFHDIDPNPNAYAPGTVTIRLFAEMDEAGDTITAPYSAGVRKPDGTVVAAYEAMSLGTRMGLEPAIALEPAATPAAEAAATPIASAPPESGSLDVLWESTGDPDLPLADPFEMAIDPQGNLWVADGRNSRFQIFAPDGTFLEAWGTPGSGEGKFDFTRSGGHGLGAVAFDAEGNIYVVDTGNYRVQKFDTERQFVTAWGSQGKGDGQFLDPIGIGINPDGRIYVIDDEREDVQVFDADGAFLSQFGGFGVDPGKILDAGSGIAFDRDGNVLIADFGNQRIERFAPDGTFLETWGTFGSAPGRFINPNDIVIDADGRIYVVDLGNHRVQVFAPDGEFLATRGRFGSNPGELLQPAVIVLDGEGNAYVGDRGNVRIQKFRSRIGLR